MTGRAVYRWRHWRAVRQARRYLAGLDPHTVSSLFGEVYGS